ncbi:MAG: hypothetical protein QM723_34250 [Myxococcaceae bacterium]
MTVLRADSAALTAWATKKRREAAPVVTICVVIAAAILFINYQLMIFAIMALAIATIPSVEAIRTRRTARRCKLLELDCNEPMSLRTDGFAWPIAFDELTSASVQPGALGIMITRGRNIERWVLPADDASIALAAQALTARGVPIHRSNASTGMVVALLTGVIAVYVVSFAAAGMVLFGIIQLVLAIAGKSGSVLNGVLLIAGALTLFVGVSVAARLARG